MLMTIAKFGIKTIDTFAYYGLFLFLFYFAFKYFKEFADIFTKINERLQIAFPGLTKQEKKQRKKAANHFLTQEAPILARKKKYSLLLIILFLPVFGIGVFYYFPISDTSLNAFPYFGFAFILLGIALVLQEKNRIEESIIWQRYLLNHPQNQLKVLFLPKELSAAFLQNIRKRMILTFITGIFFLIHPLLLKLGLLFV
ncbi:hypothetical protein D920_00984 [Enterococcus faecalis 13-SD-W-01]|nr:hypothetical protein D920_00984 [Enterococcus faecalis 13-SD-W-01]